MVPIMTEEVAGALAHGRPVVALESTFIAHGLPWPDNLAIGRELEGVVRREGAVPATIAVLHGRAHVGLAETELARLAERGTSMAKASAADLAVYGATGGDCATTVSGTAVIAARAGIRVFATGGIGGVHRGTSGDVSHDLYALSTTPIAVVSAGPKAILDLPRTLESLEALGVLVIGRHTAQLPAFYSRSSGLDLPHRVDDDVTLAAILRARWDLGQGGVLVCNPIPVDAELPFDEITPAIEMACADAVASSITGKQLTPFLLSRLAAITGGRSIAANRALACHNAAVAARLAAAFHRTSSTT